MNYKQRLQAVLHHLRQEELDWLLVQNLKNIRYLSGFTGSHALLLIHPDKQWILTDGRYDEQVRFEVKHFEPVIQGQRKELEAVRDTLGDTSACRIGFEAEHFTCAKMEELRSLVPARDYISKKGVVEDLRVCKDAEEIEIVRRALAIAEDAYHAVLGRIGTGLTERELAHLLEEEMWKRGAEQKSFDTIVLFGARSSLPHGKPTDAQLKRGDIVLMDFGCIVDGYCSDITRTVFFGEPTDEQRSMYDCVRRAKESAEVSIRAGVHSKDADEFARRVIRDAGRETQFMHGLGHGVGLDIHESPRLSNMANFVLAVGNVVTVEPGVYVPGLGGIRIENMAVVTDSGCEVLNRSSTELTVI